MKKYEIATFFVFLLSHLYHLKYDDLNLVIENCLDFTINNGSFKNAYLAHIFMFSALCTPNCSLHTYLCMYVGIGIKKIEARYVSTENLNRSEASCR